MKQTTFLVFALLLMASCKKNEIAIQSNGGTTTQSQSEEVVIFTTVWYTNQYPGGQFNHDVGLTVTLNDAKAYNPFYVSYFTSSGNGWYTKIDTFRLHDINQTIYWTHRTRCSGCGVSFNNSNNEPPQKWGSVYLAKNDTVFITDTLTK